MALIVTKCKLMVFCLFRNPPAPPVITIGTSQLEVVQAARILGLILLYNLKWTGHATSIVRCLIVIYTGFVRPVLEYTCVIWHPGLTTELSEKIGGVQKGSLRLNHGSESWVLTKKDLSRLEADEMRVVKSRLDKIRNTHLRNMLGITSVVDDIERSALRWLGHVQRMNPDRIPKMAFDLKLKGKRPPGRPRKRWRDNVQEILTHRRIGRLERLEEEGVFLDRKEWKRRSELTGTKAYLGMM
ncbi:hypothetical protein Bbelb_020870 [Branchiostoma belcheri]|nr:hypothetical protein Bbelb_101530 [Branchiostoma belcheri]KAI8518830.1 hypothetical protein Bbelb_020870 [Branchiostoma belcheri]